jgi:hypothetical protein
MPTTKLFWISAHVTCVATHCGCPFTVKNQLFPIKRTMLSSYWTLRRFWWVQILSDPVDLAGTLLKSTQGHEKKSS